MFLDQRCDKISITFFFITSQNLKFFVPRGEKDHFKLIFCPGILTVFHRVYLLSNIYSYYQTTTSWALFSSSGTSRQYEELLSASFILQWKLDLLPSANEVWGKVMFSQVSVIPSVQGWRQVCLPAYITGHMTGVGGWGLHLWRRGSVSGRSASKGGSASKGWEDLYHLGTTGYGNERAVSILPECILVLYNYIQEHALF